jgi:hypothetical protein
MVGSKAFDDSGVYPIVVELRQPSTRQRTIEARLYLGCSSIDVKLSLKQILCKDYLAGLMFPLLGGSNSQKSATWTRRVSPLTS